MNDHINGYSCRNWANKDKEAKQGGAADLVGYAESRRYI